MPWEQTDWKSKTKKELDNFEKDCFSSNWCKRKDGVQCPETDEDTPSRLNREKVVGASEEEESTEGWCYSYAP